MINNLINLFTNCSDLFDTFLIDVLEKPFNLFVILAFDDKTT